MRRPLRILLLALAIVAFLAISLGLTRILSANSSERARIVELLDAQARGDAAGMIARLHGCATDAACRSGAQANAARLRSPGKVLIARLDPSTSFSFGGTRGTARVVWKTPSRITVVQCIEVDRGGDVLHGLTVELLSLSHPIGHQSSCTSTG
jgi:hypothetical protein